jgi:uncharacterized protein YeaO (DUF488 family)
MTSIRIKRVYEEPGQEDGERILANRLWPRGLTKEKARVDLWLKDVAPSTELRKWFAHDPSKWEEFRSRYLSHTDSLVRLYLQETFTFRVLTSEAAVALSPPQKSS